MNIVRLVDHFPSSKEIGYGLEPTFYNLSLEQARLGLNVHIICKGYPQKRFEEEGIHIHRVMVPYNLLMFYELLKLNRHAKVDLVHTHATSGFMYAILKWFLRGKWGKIGHVAHVHGTTKGIFSAWSKISPDVLSEETIRQRVRRRASIMRETIMWRDADALVANSKFLKEELVNLYGIPREKTHIVYNGVDLRTFYPRKSRRRVFKSLGLDLRSHVILYLGGFRPVKGPIYVMRALEKVHEKFKDIKVLFVGGRHQLDRYHDTVMMKSINGLRESGAMQVIENVPHVQLPEYYSAADAVIVSSIYDAFPKVVLESMACGTPVIASNVGGIPELVRHGETGILTEPANSDELAEAIIKVTSDSDLRERLVSKARNLVKQFTWERAAKQTLAIYKTLLRLD